MGMMIGEVAARAGVPVATIRYYESRGLIPEAPRASSGYRQYGHDAAERLRFIKRAQELGFTLDDVQEILGLRVDDPATCPAVEAKTREKIEHVRRKIRDLQRIEDALERVAASCGDRRATVECPILESLAEGEADA
jgi:Hg(II)-responsive transcriptional regulator